MKRNVLVVGLALLFSSLVLASACAPGGEKQPTVVQPTTLPTQPPPPPPARPPSGQLISVGERVEGALAVHGSHKAYELTAPSDGLLVVELSWNTKQGNLELWLEDTQFAQHASPTIGTVTVSAGRRYRLRVFDGAPWDYDDLYVPFVLTTTIE
jgi:hypothetical protein